MSTSHRRVAACELTMFACTEEKFVCAMREKLSSKASRQAKNCHYHKDTAISVEMSPARTNHRHKPNNLNSEAGVGKIRLQNASLGNVSVLSQKELQKVDVIGRALRIRGE